MCIDPLKTATFNGHPARNGMECMADMTSAAISGIFMHSIYLNPGNLGRSTQLTSTFYELEVGFASWQHKLYRMHLLGESFSAFILPFLAFFARILALSSGEMQTSMSKQRAAAVAASGKIERAGKLKDAAKLQKQQQ